MMNKPTNQIEVIEYDIKTHEKIDDYVIVMNNLLEENESKIKMTKEQLKKNLNTAPSTTKTKFWLLYLNNEIAGRYKVDYPTTDNKHSAFLDIFVLPHSRRKGIGKQVLNIAVKDCIKEGRSTIIGGSTDKGKEWCEEIGAKCVLHNRLSKLKHDDIDFQEIEKKLVKYREKLNKLIELTFYVNGIPDSRMEETSQLMNVIWNLAPRGDMDLQDFTRTPEQLKEEYDTVQARNSEIWTVIAQNRENSELCGLTEVSWQKNYPEEINQLFTGVLPEYQGQGIGSLIKLEMMSRLKDRGGKFDIETGNAYVNEPVLRINEKLGYKKHKDVYSWQITADEAKTYKDRIE